MSDPRLKDIQSAARSLPPDSALIYRHFGANDKQETAHQLRQICFARGNQFLIGNDPELAVRCGADGVHFTQKSMMESAIWRKRCPQFVLTCAVHDAASLKATRALPLDAVTLSPIFESLSPSAKYPLGIERAGALIKQSAHPVIALGGINRGNAKSILSTGAAGLAGVSAIVLRA